VDASKDGGNCGPHFFCSCNLKDEKLWLNHLEVLPFVIDCTFHRLRLDWNMTSNRFRDFGSNVYTKYYGTGEGLGFVEPVFASLRKAFLPLGYPADNSLFADVVFDFRVGPREWEAPPGASSFYLTGDLERLRLLIEQKKKDTGRKVILTSISEGGTLTRSFLHAQNQSWKTEHILGWASLSTPFAGSKEIGFHFLSGDSAYKKLLPWLDVKKFRDTTEAWSGLMAVAPIPSGIPEADDAPYIVTPYTNFSVKRYRDALVRAGRWVTADVWNFSIPEVVAPTVPPGVPMLCLRGTGIKTIAKVTYDTDDMSDASAPEFEYDLGGDGTVHHESLVACERWTNAPNVSSKAYNNVTHSGILSSEAALADIVRWVSSLI